MALTVGLGPLFQTNNLRSTLFKTHQGPVESSSTRRVRA